MSQRRPLVAIGASAGGIAAVRRLLAELGPGFPSPLALVLHVSEGRPSHLDRALSGEVRVIEACDKQEVAPGTVVVAPPGYHLLVESVTSFALSTEAPVHFCRPAIDVLFESAADVFGAAAVGVLLTGANDDGAAGLAAIESCGGRALIQDPETAESPRMPRAGIATCRAPLVGPIEGLARWLRREAT